MYNPSSNANLRLQLRQATNWSERMHCDEWDELAVMCDRNPVRLAKMICHTDPRKQKRARRIIRRNMHTPIATLEARRG